jgi:1-acyl-sn-glycerol-3-phosphate acyltransferase
MLGFGMWTTFLCQFEGEKDYRVATLNGNFYFPILRELLLFLGFVSANKKTLNHVLKDGKSVVIMVGGAEEALHHQGIILNKRKGFVELAVKNKVPLVPVYTFGENELYSVKKGSDFIQQHVKKWFGITIPLFYGRFWLFPRRKQLFTVLGAPVEPSDSVEETHARFKTALLELYDKYRPTGYPSLVIIK